MAKRPVVLDCQQLAYPHMAVIDQLARLQLALRRDGCELQLRNADDSVLDLVGFAGLAEVLRVEMQRESEEGKQPGGIEEEHQLGDPPL
jgi:anti-anti-sigma regulatory factor